MVSCNVTQTALPRWNLKDFYDSMDSSALKDDLRKLDALTSSFTQKYEQRFLKSFPEKADELAEAIQAYEVIQELAGKIMSYAYLNYATHQNDPKVLQFFQQIQESVTPLSTRLIFFTLDLNALEPEEIESLLANSDILARYRPWIEAIRLFREHRLSPDLEKLLHEKSVSGRQAWIRLHDETLARLQFEDPLEAGKPLTLTELLDLLNSPHRSLRHQASETLHKKLSENLPLFSLVSNMLAKDKETEDAWRKYPHPVAERNLSNQVEDNVVETLFQTVKEGYPRLGHRYYALKAKWMGLPHLEYWDRNAPLSDAGGDCYSWEEAKEIILDAYGRFSPELGELAEQFFVNPWIDAACDTGKTSGAFSHPTIPSLHPYILMSYQGRTRDVMTLAHELGHGVHQLLSRSQGPLMADTPLTIAETASVFGEMLTFRELLLRTHDPLKKRALLSSKVEDMLNTVIRQIAFFDFEKRFHEKRRRGEVLPEEISELFLDTQREALGPAVNLSPLVRHFWAYISHFIHAPFYVYAYAFGDCLVNSLYAVFERGHPDFQAQYLGLLRSGGSKRYPELLAPFGLDAGSPHFWQGGLMMIEKFIDDLESL